MKTLEVCPVSKEVVDENKTRVIAFFVIVVAVAGIYFRNYYVLALLAVDFAIRAFTGWKNASVLGLTARVTAAVLHIPNKPCDAAPKKFSAGIGMFFSLGMALFQFVQLYTVAAAIGAALLMCAFLECCFGYCLGCKVYSLLQLFRR
ncbi:MAG: DUF4395 domain-containing protein [Bacteroidales bacterium]|jgi:hypothetical protein|nr:DUF4395 domain-containing protein [Bacteroidales bacterium]